MSLRAIHLLVMSCSIAFAFFFAFWALQDYFNGTQNIMNLSLGILSLIAGFVMIPYIFWFRGKTRQS